jgi:hypothetical protein
MRNGVIIVTLISVLFALTLVSIYYWLGSLVEKPSSDDMCSPQIWKDDIGVITMGPFRLESKRIYEVDVDFVDISGSNHLWNVWAGVPNVKVNGVLSISSDRKTNMIRLAEARLASWNYLKATYCIYCFTQELDNVSSVELRNLYIEVPHTNLVSVIAFRIWTL